MSLALAGSALGQDAFVTIGGRKANPNKIVAKLKPGASVTEAVAQINSNDLIIRKSLDMVPGLMILENIEGDEIASQYTSSSLASQRVRTLQSTGLFEYIEPDYIYRLAVEPDDERFVDGTLWGLKNDGQDGGVVGADINATVAWDKTTGSKDVIVAVVDSGINTAHLDLIEQLWVNEDEIADNGIDDDNDGYIDNMNGIDAVSGSGMLIDTVGHGTHVAGTIGAAANDGNPHVGVMWNVQLMGLRVGGEFLSLAAIVEAINFAAANGAKVINASYGGGYSQAERDAIEAAGALGIVFVAAAGNSSLDMEQFPFYPAAFDLENVISVAAINRFNTIAEFSNYGRTTVDLAAPGVDIFSTYIEDEDSYSTLQGTSMAAPHVTGCVGLIFSIFPDATIDEVKTRLFDTVVPVPSLQGLTVTGGRIDIGEALNVSGDGVLEVNVSPLGGSTFFVGEEIVLKVRVTDLVGISDADVTGEVIETKEQIVFLNDGEAPDEALGDATYTGVYTVPADSDLESINITINATAPDKEPNNRTVRYNIVRPAVNHYFADAIKISPSGSPEPIKTTNRTAAPVEGEVDLALHESGEPNHADVATSYASLWYNWSPSFSGKVLLDTTGSSVNTIAAVYTGSRVNQLTEVASTTLALNGAPEAQLDFEVEANVTYRIAVAGDTTDDQGFIRFRVERNGVPDTVGPVVTVTEPVSGFTTADNLIQIIGTSFDPSPNASGVREVLVQVNQDIANFAFGAESWNTFAFLKVGSNRITVSAVDFANNASEPVVFNVNYFPVVLENDLFVNSIQLTGSSSETPVIGNNELALKEFGEPNHGGNEGGKSVWYSWRAPRNGVLTLSTENSSFDTLLGLYTGNRVRSLTQVAQNDDADAGVSYSKIAQAVQAGQLYRIAVDGFGLAFGDFELTYSFEPAENLYTVEASVSESTGGSINFTQGVFISGSTLRLVATPFANYRFVRWEGTVNSRQPQLDLVVESNVILTAFFAPIEVAEGFESGFSAGLDWSLDNEGSSLPWTIQSDVVFSGDSSLSSGAISNNQKSILKLTAESPGGLASFSFKVSSEPNWDTLKFYAYPVGFSRPVNALGTWSGEVEWKRFEFNLVPGPVVLEWIYSKDFGGSAGSDAAFIDNLVLPQIMVEPGSFALTAQMVEGQIALNLMMEPVPGNPTFILEGSNDLMEWTAIESGIIPGESVIIDPSQSMRFYRAVFNP
jgi:subtilisin family serine protease